MSNSPSAAIASGHPSVSHAGAELLRAGGNAVDAAVGAAFASFVAEPLLTSPAGAGFAVSLIGDQAVASDFFATAPGLGRSDGPWQPPPGSFFPVECDFGSATQEFHIGAGSVAVPSAAPGLLALHAAQGVLPREQVLGPARRLAQSGAPVTGIGRAAEDLLWPIVASTDEMRATFVDAHGAPLAEGAVYRNRDLVHFIDAAVIFGEDVFRRGPVALALLDRVQRAGGGLTQADLDAYEVVQGAPVRAHCGSAELLLASGATCGGLWLALATALLDGLPAPRVDSRDEALLLRAVMAVTERARVELIGAQTPGPEHVARLLDSAVIARGRRAVRELLALGVAEIPPWPDNLHGSTTHLSVIDAAGGACSVTVSNGESSGLVVPGFGVFLNNFLGEGDLNPLGFHGFAPGARLGSAMCPALVRQRDGSVLATGSGGSSRIRTALLQVLRRRLVHGQDLATAVRADRLHVEAGRLLLEGGGNLGPVAAQLAKELDTTVFPAVNMYFGGAHSVLRGPDCRCEAVGDPRRSGSAVYV